MIKVIRQSLLKFSVILAKNRGRKIVDKFERFVDEFHRSINNVNFNMEENGESRVLRILSSNGLNCIFDVGANVGDWTIMISKMNPDAVIHSFEIVPDTFNILVKTIGNNPSVILNNFGLSDSKMKININMGKEGSSTATAFPIEGMEFHDNYYNLIIPCEARTASDYIKENDINHIDFVKIDVEGMDLRVIKGFYSELNIVDVIQFEYGIFDISSHDLLSDFCNYLNKKGFVVGKIFPKCVKFFSYDMHMENFHGSNFLAVKKEKTELIKKLSEFSD
jgi:FkbM family methyltransferase